MTTLAIDPGGSTGLAWQDDDLSLHTVVAPSKWAVYGVIRQLQPTTIILERFVTGQRLNQYSRLTIEICGGVEALAHFLGATLIYHKPAAREPWMDQALEILTAEHGPRGAKSKGHGVFTDHEQDALAHELAWLETGK